MNRQHMQEAITLSRLKMLEKCGGPFGAVIVKNGNIIARGWNRVTSTNDPTAHAEIVAIRDACQALNTYDLSGTELYASCEPCPMCLAAIYWAGISSIYYAATRKDAAGIGFADDSLYKELQKSIPERTVPMVQLLREEAVSVFAEWDQLEDKILY